MSPHQALSATDTETEIKLWVPDLSPIEARLREAGARLTQERSHEFNLRFDHPELHLLDRRAVLRLRKDQVNTLTYKDDARIQEGIISRYELETEVASFEITSQLLQKLGFFISDRYEKYRTAFQLDQTEIVLDELPFGNFVEIEGLHDDIKKAIGRLELSQATPVNCSYLHLFHLSRLWLERERNIHLEEFSFQGFAGITLPIEQLLQNDQERPLE
ncbi:MAG: class IV adenylate cyclase [Anaerolineaceae bacterium]|nr:class IV adenylate cyclase [Anaerolineaceae bacterium]